MKGSQLRLFPSTSRRRWAELALILQARLGDETKTAPTFPEHIDVVEATTQSRFRGSGHGDTRSGGLEVDAATGVGVDVVGPLFFKTLMRQRSHEAAGPTQICALQRLE